VVNAIGHPLQGNVPVLHGFDPRLYNENVFVAKLDHTGNRIGELSSCSSDIGKSVVEEGLEVSV
jgi:hypothetical protein